MTHTARHDMKVWAAGVYEVGGLTSRLLKSLILELFRMRRDFLSSFLSGSLLSLGSLSSFLSLASFVSF
jgi:hypothetical protein